MGHLPKGVDLVLVCFFFFNENLFVKQIFVCDVKKTAAELF